MASLFNIVNHEILQWLNNQILDSGIEINNCNNTNYTKRNQNSFEFTTSSTRNAMKRHKGSSVTNPRYKRELAPNMSRGRSAKTYKLSTDSIDSKASDTASTSCVRTHINPSTRAYRIRRSASKILEKLKDIPADELSERDKSSLQWAEENVNFRFPNSSLYKPNTISQSSQKPVLNDNTAKYPRMTVTEPSTNHTLSNVAEDYLTLAIVDFSNCDGSISPMKWKNVEIALMKSYREVLNENPGPPPSCRDAGWYENKVKLIACSDQRSADLYKSAVARVGEIWPGANLKAVTKLEIPNRPKSKGWFPAEPSSTKLILELIQICNPNLPTKDWEVMEVSEIDNHLRQVFIVINEESLAPLASIDYTINYGFGSVKLTVYKDDQANSEAVLKLTTQPSTSLDIKPEIFNDQNLVLPSAESECVSNTNTNSNTNVPNELPNNLILPECDIKCEILSDQEDSEVNIINNHQNNETNVD